MSDWWNKTDEEFTSFQKQHEFMLDNYRQIAIKKRTKKVRNNKKSLEIKGLLYLNFNKLKSYFPKGYTMQQCEDTLWEILDKF